MSQKKMPVIFAGHGSPMLALEDTAETRTLRDIGAQIVAGHGTPQAILAVSAHWYTKGTLVQRTESPEQIYDMYGFPQELYDFAYPVRGDLALADRTRALLGDTVTVDNDWGIDHGTWTVLCHMFPAADVPVVQLSVDATRPADALYAIGRALAPLRAEGYLIFASGNVVHNLRRIEWENAGGSPEAEAFNADIIARVRARDDRSIMDYAHIAHAAYAVPTPDHYLPLIYMLGAAEGETPHVFNNVCHQGAIAMTGFAFGLA